MNWVDLVIIIVFLFFALEGLGKSFYIELFELGSFLLAFFFSLRFYNFIAEQLKNFFSLPHSFANVLGFIAVWYIVEIAFFIWARVFFHRRFESAPKLPYGGILSIIPAFLRGFIFVAIMLVLIGTFPIQPRVKSEVDSSKIGSWILAGTYQIEAPLKNIFGGLAQDTLTFLTVQPKTSESVDLGFRNNNFNFDEKAESAMIDLVNKERIKVGKRPLSFDVSLREVARGHSADMFRRGYFSHFTPEGRDLADRAKEGKINFLVIGENLAFAPTLELAHQGLMNSPGHKANILSDDYQNIGIGAAVSSQYGIMFTQVFRN